MSDIVYRMSSVTSVTTVTISDGCDGCDGCDSNTDIIEGRANQIIKNKERYVKNFRRRTYVDMDLIMLDFGVGTTG